MYTPYYQFDGLCRSVQRESDRALVPLEKGHPDYIAFTCWLIEQGKTFQQFLAEHPYTPPFPDPESPKRSQAVAVLKAAWPTMTAKERAVVVILKSVCGELRDIS